jgi:hypothetical protein
MARSRKRANGASRVAVNLGGAGGFTAQISMRGAGGWPRVMISYLAARANRPRRHFPTHMCDKCVRGPFPCSRAPKSSPFADLGVLRAPRSGKGDRIRRRRQPRHRNSAIYPEGPGRNCGRKSHGAGGRKWIASSAETLGSRDRPVVCRVASAATEFSRASKARQFTRRTSHVGRRTS